MSEKVPVRAVIMFAGELGKNYGEPRARILEGRHAGKEMPMGWNAGQVIEVGTEGMALYEMGSGAGLWGFTATRVGVDERA